MLAFKVPDALRRVVHHRGKDNDRDDRVARYRRRLRRRNG